RSPSARPSSGCSPMPRSSCARPAGSSGKARGRPTAGRTRGSRPPSPSCTRARCSGAWSTRPSRSTAATASPRSSLSSGGTARRVSAGSAKARPRCTAWSSPDHSSGESHLQVNPMPDEILTEIVDGVATVTLNRPEKRNAMSSALLRGLRTAFDELDEDARVRVVVVRGAGRAFCSGMDLREMGERRGAADPDSGVTEILQRVERSRHPTIAMVHGDAIAGGCELALHCDLRIAAEPARLGMPLARIGLLVPFALGQKLVEILGSAHTRHLLLTGRPIDARRAWEIGMIHQVVPAAELETAVAALSRTLADNAPLSLSGIKAVIQRTISAREQITHEDL